MILRIATCMRFIWMAIKTLQDCLRENKHSDDNSTDR